MGRDGSVLLLNIDGEGWQGCFFLLNIYGEGWKCCLLLNTSCYFVCPVYCPAEQNTAELQWLEP